mmetsp:Transcript_16090/g.38764  ORF Transcript_16090/g.38764 Transcript_16090/m.38764 type:complete len:213 (+) Transcript_16090:486-1124(+)
MMSRRKRIGGSRRREKTRRKRLSRTFSRTGTTTTRAWTIQCPRSTIQTRTILKWTSGTRGTRGTSPLRRSGRRCRANACRMRTHLPWGHKRERCKQRGWMCTRATRGAGGTRSSTTRKSKNSIGRTLRQRRRTAGIGSGSTSCPTSGTSIRTSLTLTGGAAKSRTSRMGKTRINTRRWQLSRKSNTTTTESGSIWRRSRGKRLRSKRSFSRS